MKKGFTLIELLMVVIIIAVLATIAVPQYLNAVERAKIAKARNENGLISQALKMYRADPSGGNDDYSGASLAILNRYVELGIDTTSGADPQGDWGYGLDDLSSTGFTVIATRSRGAHMDRIITLDETGTERGNHPLR